MIGPSLYTLLSGHAPLTDLVGSQIYPVRAPQEKENPMVIFGVTSTEPQESKTLTSREDWYQAELVIYADDYDLSVQIAEEVRAALDKQSGTIASKAISDIVFRDYEDGWEEQRECYAPIIKFLVIASP